MLLFYWLIILLVVVLAALFSTFDKIGKDVTFFESPEELDEMCWQGLRRGPQ
jgi:hypothetical protein|tara:strand:- start:92 stop:247 length:156 start_codon:yes stop_codon:yes gene_type:complete